MTDSSPPSWLLAAALAVPMMAVATVGSATAEASPAPAAVAAPAAAPASAAKPRPRAPQAASRSMGRASAQMRLAMACKAGGGAGARGLKAWPTAVRGRIGAEFDVARIGGYRPGRGRSDHHRGMALDVMVRGAKGDRIAGWTQANARTLNVKYVIWKQRIWHPGKSWKKMGNRGNATANHFDHVHISFKPGTGRCPVG